MGGGWRIEFPTAAFHPFIPFQFIPYISYVLRLAFRSRGSPTGWDWHIHPLSPLGQKSRDRIGKEEKSLNGRTDEVLTDEKMTRMGTKKHISFIDWPKHECG
jgi:hypothetical protein